MTTSETSGTSPEAAANRRDTGVLVVDDERSLRFTLCEALQDEGYAAYEAADGAAAFALLRERPIHVVLLDLRLQASGENGLDILRAVKKDYPEVQVVMMTAYGKFDDALEAGRAGCYQFIAKPFQLEHVKLVLEGALETSALRREVEVLRRAGRGRFPADTVIGESERFRQVMTTVRKVAPSRATILLVGETGTGKEVLARAIHRASSVAEGPLVEVNCSAVPENLLESELFGHEKGAFTDAKDRKKGVFELADKGTLFLDEIGDMARNLQAKLLRVLETGSFKRVGGTVDLEVTVRVVAATNCDLKKAVAEGRFREDLYFRLAVVTLAIPPLRERREDILLARHFLDHFNREMATGLEGFSPEAESALLSHAWPGNIRELRNVVERGVLLAAGPRMEAANLPLDVLTPASGEGTRIPMPPPGKVWTLAELERDGIRMALERHGGNKTRAAEALGISRGTLRTKIRDYGLAED